MGNPHDALFKRTFAEPEHAEGELRTALPAGLVAQLDFGTLRVVPGELVDAELRGQRTDILYAVERIGGGEVLVYVLFEHQSAPDPWMGYRLLRYMVRIWEAHLREDGAAKLPLIVPLVLHHGPGGWTAARSLGELLDAEDELMEAARPYVPHFTFVVDDLAAETDATLRRRSMTAMGRLVLACLRHARDEDLVAALWDWASVCEEVWAAPSGPEAMKAVMSYIAKVGAGPKDEARAFFASLGSGAEEVYVATIAEQLKAEGREQGLAQGQRALVLRQLERRFGPLDEESRERVDRATVQDLERWAEQLLTAATLDDALR
jgi:predicted transposase YdaD